MAVLKVYNGASWGVAIGKTYNGAAWEDQMKFYDGSAWQELYATGPAVSMFGGINYNYRASGYCYAGTRFNAAGDEKWMTQDAAWTTNKGNWLDSGAPSEVWIQRTINSGTLGYDGIGSGRVALTSDRFFYIWRNTSGVKTCVVTCYMYDAASGGNLLESKQYTLQADRG